MMNSLKPKMLQASFLSAIVFVSFATTGCSSGDNAAEADSQKAKTAESLSSKPKKKGPAFNFNAKNTGNKSGGAGSAKSNFSPKIKFTEVDESVGLDFIYQNGETGVSLMVETTGGGSGWLDFDLDGKQDVYLNQGGSPKGRGESTEPNDEIFRQVDAHFVSVANRANIFERGYSQGVATGDFDGDGFDDIYVTNAGVNKFFKNMGDGSFEDATESTGLGDFDRWSSSAAWTDLDLDGDLDLYVCNYVQYDRFDPIICVDDDKNPSICHPNQSLPWPDAFYVNNGDGTFSEESKIRGLFADDNKALAVAIADYNRDGYPDVYIANDTLANFLYINDGKCNFKEEARLVGCAVERSGSTQASMGLGVFDFDRNGFLDIYSTHYTEESNTLYANKGKAGFEDVTAKVDLHTVTKPWLGFGTIMGDFDCDSLTDIFIAQGHVNNSPHFQGKLKMEPAIFCYDGKDFQDVRETAGEYFKKTFLGRGVSSCDFDDDGDLDLLVSNQNDRANLLRNDSPRGSYVKLQFVGIESNRAGRGVQVSVTTDDPKKPFYHELVAGSSYVSSNQQILVFGLGDFKGKCKVDVRWPNGKTQVLTDVAVDQSMIVVENE